MKKLSNDVITLARFSGDLADRFEKLGLDEEGAMDPTDKKLLDRVRKQIDKVLSAPMKSLMKS
jgi:hypothetical protein